MVDAQASGVLLHRGSREVEGAGRIVVTRGRLLEVTNESPTGALARVVIFRLGLSWLTQPRVGQRPQSLDPCLHVLLRQAEARF